MVRFIFGPGGSGKTELVMKEIRRVLEKSDRRVILIVPEQHTVSTEARLARDFDSSCALRMEATNFTRLSDTVSRKVGGISYTHLTHGARMLILWRAMMSVWGSLRELSSIDSGDEVKLLPGVYAANRELALEGISPEALGRAADELEEAEDSVHLSRKAHDMALISAAAASAMAEDFSDVTDPVEKLTRCAAESGIFEGVSVFVDSFYSLTGAESAALSEIIRLSEDVTVVIPMESPHTEGVHLDGVRKYYLSALRAAMRRGDALEITVLEGNKRARSAEISCISNHLWNYGYKGIAAREGLPILPDSVKLWSVTDRYSEAEALCARIASLVRSGCRYSDIAVVCADASRLRGITDYALRAHGIPAFISESAEISSSPGVRLIFSLLSSVGSWRREDIVSAVKTGLTPLQGETAWAFEAFTETWNIRGARMFSSPWTMNPDGYREEFTDRGRRTLMLANEGREALIPHIERFSDTFTSGKATVTQICSAIVDFFERTGAYLRMEERADRLEVEGAPDDAARERLVWREICTSFDTMVEIVGNSEVNTAGFASLFRHVIADADTGAIPTGIDQVTFASAAGLRTDGVRHMILLGAVDGEFPGTPAEDSYFTDSDRERLAEVGVILAGDSGIRASEELFRFGKAVSQAEDSLTVFVPRMTDGGVCRPSEGVRRICELLGRDSKELPDFFKEAGTDAVFDASSLLDAWRRGGNISRAAGQVAAEMLGEKALSPYASPEADSVSEALAQDIFGSSVRLSQSRIDTFVKCPFSYYCKYVLRLAEDRKAEISAPDIGSFVHSVLEEFFSAVKDRELPIPREEAEAICDSVIKRYSENAGEAAGVEEDGRLKYLFARLRRQVSVFIEEIMEEAVQSRFEMYASELPVGMADEAEGRAVPPAVVFPMEDGGEVSLHGILDRMDVYRAEDGQVYVRVVDYKTGSAKFSYDDVRLGLNIQLLLYLFAAWHSDGTRFSHEISDGNPVLPAGALYLSVKPGDKTSLYPLTEEEARDLFKSKIERSGIVTDDREVLDAMDRGITGRFTPISLNKDGGYKKSPSLTTLEGFGKLYRQLGETVSKIAAEMKSGRAEAEPLVRPGKDPCTYCKLHGICRRKGGASRG